MSQKQNNKVVSFRRPPNGGNIGVVIFAAIFIYIIICVFMYFTQKHIESYQVKMGSLSSNNVYKGIALRDEEIISATKSGYINYYAREGQRVGVGNLVYTIDESGKLADYLNTNGEGTTLTDKDLSELKTEILGFVNSFDHEEFASVYDFKNSVQGMVQKLSSANILDNIDKINSSGVSELVSLCTAPATGIVVFSTDGYEQVQLEDMTEELFDTKKYEKTQLINNELVASGDPVYKISEDEDWSIVIPVDADKEKELLDAEYVNVKFLKNQDTSWGKVSSFTNPDGDIFVMLTFTNSMVTFCTDRFIDVELILEDEAGLKIPNSSIVEKEFFIVPKDYVTKGGNSNNFGVMRETYTEDGTATVEFIETNIYNETDEEYYVDDMTLRIGDYIVKPESTEKYPVSKRGSLIGVYHMNKGYAGFKQINILYQNEEYSIVKSNTQYGLSVYDYIVLDATTVNEDELIYE